MKDKEISLNETLLVLLVLFSVLATGVIFLHLNPPVLVLITISLLFLWGALRKVPLSEIQEGMEEGVKAGIIPIFIFLLVGVLIALWIKGGIIPTLMVYGFQMISVNWFVPTVFLVCAVIGSAVGSAFTVMSTIGVAFFGMGVTLQLPEPLIVGAIVSGAVFGDKVSPLSESTNLTAAIVEADLFDHIKNLMYSTLPAFVVSGILFFIFGRTDGSADLSQINHVVALLKENFVINGWQMLPIVLMLLCAWLKVPALATLFLNCGFSIVLMAFQGVKFTLQELFVVMESGYTSKIGDKLLDPLLSRGGMSSMLPTISLIILTLALGGILLHLGFIQRVMSSVGQKINSDVSLILATLLSGLGVNLFVGEQYLSVILPGKAFLPLYHERKLAPVALGRTLEDGGTVINYLIPWGVAGSFVAHTFGVPTLAYLPFAFFSLLSPVFSILSAITGIGVKKEEV